MHRLALSKSAFVCLAGVLWLLAGVPAALASGPSEICRDTQKQTGYWRVWPDGKAEFGGTPAVRCFRGGYEEVAGSVISGYECNADYSSCTFGTPYEVTDTLQNPDGTTTLYWRNKKRPWSKGSMAFYSTATDSTPAAKPEESGLPVGTLIDPYGDGPAYPFRNGADWEEFWRDGRATVHLLHYVNTKNSENACIFGELLAAYKLDYRPDMQVLYDQEINSISSPLVNNTVKAGQYDESVWKSLVGKSVVHCYRLVHPRVDGKVVLPRWYDKRGSLHGVIVSPHTAARYRVEGNKVVEMTPLKACCDEAKGICLGLVPWNQGCPRGKSVPGALGNGQFTSCAVCSNVPAPVPEESPEGGATAPSVGCCRNGKCTPSPSSLSCAASGGLPLEPEGACPASGPDPCRAAPSPAKPKKPGACLFNDKPCKEVESKEACRKLPGYVMFLEGSSCGVKKGGCCDGTNPCFPSSHDQCKGEFFEGGCPAKCPEQKGRCTKRCEATDEELCQDTTKAECAAVDGAVFAAGAKCTFRSAELQCAASACGECPGVRGAWRLDDKTELVFYNGCRGALRTGADGPPIPFNYSCRDNRTIDVEYGRNTLELQLFVDGAWRSLQRR